MCDEVSQEPLRQETTNPKSPPTKPNPLQLENAKLKEALEKEEEKVKSLEKTQKKWETMYMNMSELLHQERKRSECLESKRDSALEMYYRFRAGYEALNAQHDDLVLKHLELLQLYAELK
jgi:hypothetical protein